MFSSCESPPHELWIEQTCEDPVQRAHFCVWDTTEESEQPLSQPLWLSHRPSSYQALCSSHGPHVRQYCCVDAFATYCMYVYIYISSQPMLPLRGTWMSNVDTRADGKEGGRTGPHRPATPPLPRILSANGSAGIWEWGWRWTETDGSWQTRTDSQWIQGSVAERSEQERIKERLTFKVLPCLVPPHRQLRGKCLRLVSWSFCQAAVVRLSGQPSSSHTNFDTQQICTQPLLSRTRDMPAVSQNN